MSHPCRSPGCSRGTARGPGHPGLLSCCQGGLACLESDPIRGQGAGRAEITGPREGAKPRSSDERRTIFRQSPRAAPVEPFLGKGYPGRQPSSAKRARLPGKRSGTWAEMRCFADAGSLQLCDPCVAMGQPRPAACMRHPRLVVCGSVLRAASFVCQERSRPEYHSLFSLDYV
jgi:hypothetical protein